MMGEYFERPVFHDNRAVYLDSSIEFETRDGIEKILSKCNVRRGRIWEVNKGTFTRQRPSFEDFEGYVLSVFFDDAAENMFVSELEIKLMKDRYGSRIQGRNVLCYALEDSYLELKGDDYQGKELFGISFDRYVKDKDGL